MDEVKEMKRGRSKAQEDRTNERKAYVANSQQYSIYGLGQSLATNCFEVIFYNTLCGDL